MLRHPKLTLTKFHTDSVEENEEVMLQFWDLILTEKMTPHDMLHLYLNLNTHKIYHKSEKNKSGILCTSFYLLLAKHPVLKKYKTQNIVMVNKFIQRLFERNSHNITMTYYQKHLCLFEMKHLFSHITHHRMVCDELYRFVAGSKIANFVYQWSLSPDGPLAKRIIEKYQSGISVKV